MAETFPLKLRQRSRIYLDRIKRRIKYLEDRVAAHPDGKDTAYDRAELAALRWVVTLLEDGFDTTTSMTAYREYCEEQGRPVPEESRKSRLRRLRAAFDEDCLMRDGFACVMCGRKQVKLSVHHIFDRHVMPNDGYAPRHGITLCDEGPSFNVDSCHRKAEQYHMTNGRDFVPGFHPLDLLEKIGSSVEQAWKDSQALWPQNTERKMLVVIDREKHDLYYYAGELLKSDEEVLAAMSEAGQ